MMQIIAVRTIRLVFTVVPSPRQWRNHGVGSSQNAQMACCGPIGGGWVGRGAIRGAGGMMRFSLLGQLRVVDDRGESVALGGLKQRAVLGALLTHANQVVAKSRLAEWLWPGDQPPSAAHSIEVYVSR